MAPGTMCNVFVAQVAFEHQHVYIPDDYVAFINAANIPGITALPAPLTGSFWGVSNQVL